MSARELMTRVASNLASSRRWSALCSRAAPATARRSAVVATFANPWAFALSALVSSTALLPAAAVVTWVSPASGGGYNSGVKGARASGRGGAFTAKADDLSAAALNPAGLTKLESTTLHVGNRFSYNHSSFTRAPTLDWGNTAGGVPPYVQFERVENGTPAQPLDPLLGVSTRFGLREWAFGLVAYSPAGVARQEFPVDGGQRYMMVSRNSVWINYALTAAWQPSEILGLGITFQNVAIPQLDYELVIDGTSLAGAANPVTSPFDMRAKISGGDLFTPQLIVGAWLRPVPSLEFGLSGQVLPGEVVTQSTLDITPLGSRLQDGEVRLSRNMGLEPANDVSLTLPLPLTARAGVRYIGLEGKRELFDVELDVVYETWSSVERFVLDSNGLTAELYMDQVPINVVNVEKQWQDTLSFHLGSDVAVADSLTLRGGVYYETAVADPAWANVDFPSGQQLGAALGTSIHLGELEVALVYEYRHQPNVVVTEGAGQVTQEVPGSQCQAPYTDPSTCSPEYLGQRSPTVNGGTFRAHSHVGALDVLYRF